MTFNFACIIVVSLHIVSIATNAIVRAIATDVTDIAMCVCLSVSLSVSLLVTIVSPAKAAELIDIPFGETDSRALKKSGIRRRFRSPLGKWNV